MTTQEENLADFTELKMRVVNLIKSSTASVEVEALESVENSRIYSQLNAGITSVLDDLIELDDVNTLAAANTLSDELRQIRKVVIYELEEIQIEFLGLAVETV